MVDWRYGQNGSHGSRYSLFQNQGCWDDGSIPSDEIAAEPHVSDWTKEDEDEYTFFLEITPREDELKLLDESDDEEVEPLPLDHRALLDH